MQIRRIVWDDLIIRADCLAGPDPLAPVPAECLQGFDLDHDAFIDLADVAALQNQFDSVD